MKDSTGFYATINDSTFIGKESHNKLYLNDWQNSFVKWKTLNLQLKFSDDKVIIIDFTDSGSWDAKTMVGKTYLLTGNRNVRYLSGLSYGFYYTTSLSWEMLYSSSQFGGSGSVTITKVDEIRKTVSGVFKGDILNNGSSILHIKDGKFFDLKYYEEIEED
ncbi:MAG: hypothetical protein EOP53_16450 [Sphingobacteriales bacterium]|nr:MAG: hypothetical protein EOP53_16450 [Sphingobacteriales bacterium]